MMNQLLHGLINAYCGIRVAASPLLIGALLGFGLFMLIRGPVGIVAGGTAVFFGLILGIRLALHVHKKGQLLDHAYGLPPIEQGEDTTENPESR